MTTKTFRTEHRLIDGVNNVLAAPYQGQPCAVLRALDPGEADLHEVGMMYRVRFGDGYEADVFEDELS